MSENRAEKIVRDYGFHNRIVHFYADGLTHEETVWQLPFAHNCFNWILGHIVANRSHALEALGGAHAWRDEVRSLYHDGTPPIQPHGPAVPLPQLLTWLDASVVLMGAALADKEDAWLDEAHNNYRGEKSRYAHVTGFHWHEGFHLGQLEMVKAFIESRRQAGA